MINVDLIEIYKFYSSSSLEYECFLKCRASYKCVLFAYNPSKNNICLLFNSTKGSALFKDSKYEKSWYLIIPVVRFTNLGKWMTSSDLSISTVNKKMNSNNATDCWKLCRNDNQCEMFTFDSFNKICLISNTSSHLYYYY